MNRREVAWGLAFLYVASLLLSYLPLPRVIGIVFGLLGSPMFFILFYIINSVIILGARRTLIFLLLASIISFLFEYVGVHYGVPFGSYSYTSAMGLMMLGVPLFIPLLWSSLAYFTMEAAGNYYLASLGMVALDAAFDPVLSGPLGLWRWSTRGQYFGVPLTNFAGWFIVSLIIYSAFRASTGFRPKSSPVALAFYASYYASWVFADVLLGLREAGEVALIILVIYVTIIQGSTLKLKVNDH
ncbi:MAG: carotenoid biosynthesis protein [Thermocladium sp.]